MASVEAVTMTESALAEQVKVFITRFRKNGQYTYVDKIDAMMPKRIKAAVIDYNDLVAYPMLDSMFNENPDRILRAFSAAIGEILYERFPDYAIKTETIQCTICSHYSCNLLLFYADYSSQHYAVTGARAIN